MAQRKITKKAALKLLSEYRAAKQKREQGMVREEARELFFALVKVGGHDGIGPSEVEGVMVTNGCDMRMMHSIMEDAIEGEEVEMRSDWKLRIMPKLCDFCADQAIQE